MGIGALNKLIATIPEHPILNIGFQIKEEIKKALQLLGNWNIAKHAEDSTITQKHMANLLIAGFISLAWEWWH